MERKASGYHKIALAALFTVGNALIRYPWRAGERGALPIFLLSVVGALIPAWLLYPTFRWIWRRPLSHRLGRMLLASALSALFGAYALYCAWRSCADYLRFSMDLILPGGSRGLLLILFVVCAVWLSTLRDRGMDCFSLLACLCVVVCAVFLFLVGLPTFEWGRIFVDFREWEWGTVGDLLMLWRESLFPLSVLAVYFSLVEPKGGARSLAVGTAVGCAILFLCVAQAILTFGASYAAGLEYPYSYSVRVLSIGQYFFRLEGFSYLLDYLTCLIRASVSLAVARRLLGRFCPRLTRRFSWIACVGLILILQII
jgi:hypothetical protein